MPAEFELIARHFARRPQRADVRLGVGDDAAVLACAVGRELVVSTDTLVAGVHFLPAVDPRSLGHKALAVNLSDLAAMGADPAWALLALTLPAADEAWLAEFMAGFEALAAAHAVDLVGGDTTHGPLAMTVTVIGQVPAGAALRRAGARVGDGVYVSGTVGGAGAALAQLESRAVLPGAALGEARRRLDWPQPRVALGCALRGVASAAIDVSDGLAADLGHILEASGVGAVLELAAVPLGPGVPDTLAGRLDAVGAGDDYELVFTAAQPDAVARVAQAAGCAVHRIGTIEARPGLRVCAPDGSIVALPRSGYQHRV